MYTIDGTNDGRDESRSGTASFFIPSEDEWYKAAYHDPVSAGADGSGTADYWLYPTQSDTAPTLALVDANGDVTNPGANVANYNRGADWNSQNGNVTTVGGTTTTSYYGGFDLGGNVWEWNEALVTSSSRGLRGGSWINSEFTLRSSNRSSNFPASEVSVIGFRVASL